MGAMVEFVAKKAGTKALAFVEGGTGPLGWALMGTEALYHLLSDYDRKVRDEAAAIIDCVHLNVCKGWAGSTILTVEFAHKMRGCAFLYEGVPLWHQQSNLDVSRLVPTAQRYNPATGLVGIDHGALERCWSCHPR